jgi:hypothetical protein
MSNVQRVSRGFHRLGLVLAATVLLAGGFVSIIVADWAEPFPGSSPKWSWAEHQTPPKTAIKIEGFEATINVKGNFAQLAPDKQQEAVNKVAASLWRRQFAIPLAKSLAITLAVALAVYGLVRAIEPDDQRSISELVVGALAVAVLAIFWGLLFADLLS